MAQTAEAKVKNWLYGTTSKPGRLFHFFPGAYVYKPPGGMFGKTGTPDCFCLWRGVFIAIEIKAEGGKPTSPQLRELRLIGSQGGIVAILEGRDILKLQAIHEAVLVEVKRRES